MPHRFIQACRCEPVDRTPVWLMRQTGRYLPEYRSLRQEHALEVICRTPDLAAEATLQPLTRFDLDAALLFSDVALPLEPAGLPLTRSDRDVLAPGSRLESPGDIQRLRRFDPRESLGFVQDTIRIVRGALDGHRPILGLGAAPFTLACYALEGHEQRSFARVRSLMYGDPDAWHLLCATLAEIAADCLVAQIEAGAEAVQVYDSWVGTLSVADYERHVLPHSRALFDRLRDTGVPALHFGLGTGHLLEAMAAAGGDVLGVDWRIPLDDAWSRLGPARGIQGNLNPRLLVGPLDDLLAGIEDVLARAGERPGHIFNLGHGLLASTPPERVDVLTRHVHARTGPAGSRHC